MALIQEESKLVTDINATLYSFSNNQVRLIAILHCVYSSLAYLDYTFFTPLKYNCTHS
jgi:hypothetical protein